MDTGLFNVLHNGRNKSVGAVRDGICLTFQRVLQEFVHEDGTFRCHINGCCHVVTEHIVIIYHFHSAAAQYIGRTNHHRIADAVCDFQCLIHIDSHS